MRHRLIPALRWLVATLVLGCQTAPTDLRPWKPSDHTNSGESSGAALPRPGNAGANNPTKQVSGVETNTTPGLEEVTIASWRANCASCHGSMGRADGPQAPMFMPRDLSDPAWQRSVSDEQLFTSIQKGKAKMPGFALPDQVARNLVALVRLLNRERIAGTAQPSAAQPSAAQPSASQASAAPPSAAQPSAAQSPGTQSGATPPPAHGAVEPRAASSARPKG